MPDLEALARYPPAGRCIYCGAHGSEVELTEEHIVPFALAGRTVLPQSSCKKCARITGSVEQFSLRQMLGVVRAQRGLPTRRPKERPKKFSFTAHLETHTEAREEEFRLHPRIFSMLMFPYPTILYDLPADESGTFRGGRICTIRDTSDQSLRNLAVRHPDARRIEIKGQFNPLMFARMLAKIGYSFAIAEYGYDNIKSSLPALILGTQRGTNFNHLVGGSLEFLSKTENTLEMRLDRHITPITMTEFLVARIRIFPDLGAPLYYVAIGPSAGLGAPLRAQGELI